MITKTPSIIVAVTTFDSDALRISLAPIARLGRKIILIVHNDNPEVALTSRMASAIASAVPLGESALPR